MHIVISIRKTRRLVEKTKVNNVGMQFFSSTCAIFSFFFLHSHGYFLNSHGSFTWLIHMVLYFIIAKKYQDWSYNMKVGMMTESGRMYEKKESKKGQH